MVFSLLTTRGKFVLKQDNKWVSQMRAARREPAGGPEQPAKWALCFWT